MLAAAYQSFEIDQRRQINTSGDRAWADGVGIVVFRGDQQYPLRL